MRILRLPQKSGLFCPSAASIRLRLPAGKKRSSPQMIDAVASALQIELDHVSPKKPSPLDGLLLSLQTPYGDETIPSIELSISLSEDGFPRIDAARVSYPREASVEADWSGVNRRLSCGSRKAINGI